MTHAVTDQNVDRFFSDRLCSGRVIVETYVFSPQPANPGILK